MQNPFTCIYNYIKKTSIIICFSIIKLINTAKINCNSFFENYCNDYPIIKTTINNYENCVYEINKLFCNYKVEPPNLWYSIVTIKNNTINDSTMILQEKIDKNNITAFINIINEPNQSVDNENSIVLLKMENMRICRKNKIISSTYEPTKKFFLSIEYSHPEMENPIEIHLLNEYYISDNEIFSNTFVLRCLEYQTDPFVFDENYSLTIMDCNVNTVTLKYNQYILLSKNEYLIQNN